jgi:hypothetical protein
MVSKNFTLAALLFIYAASVFATCKKENCSEKEYSFNINARAYPDADSINIGDTVWIEINTSTTFIDNQSNQYVSFDRASNLSTVIGFLELLGNQQARDAANDFDVKIEKGMFRGNSTIANRFREYSIIEENGNYKLKIAIIPKKDGIYRISLSDAANVFRRGDDCSKAFFRLNFSGTNQHMYYNEWNYGVVVPLPNNGYCFKVK